MLRAYFDESGTDAGSEVVTVAGFISPEERWDHFVPEWYREILQQFEVEEFKTAAWYGKYGAFEKFRREPWASHWARPWTLLTQIIHEWVRFGVAVSVPVRQYEGLMRPEVPKGSPFEDAYVVAMQTCLEVLVTTPLRSGETVACIFDEGHVRKGRAEERFLELIRDRGWGSALVPSVTRASSRCFLPLQAADALAWAYRKRVGDLLRDPHSRPLPEWQRLKRSVRVLRGSLNVGDMMADVNAKVAAAIQAAGGDVDAVLAARAKHRRPPRRRR